MMASNLLGFALPLIALEMSGQGSDLGLIKGAGFVPNIVFAIFVGVLNDQIRKKSGFRAYTAALALGCGVLWALTAFDGLSIPALAIFMILFNGIGYALANLQMTLIRLTVSSDRLSDATALGSALNATITTIGPALGGFALLYLGNAGLVGAVSALLVVAAFASLFVTPEEPQPKRAPFWTAFQEGWVVFRANRELVMMTIVIVLTNAAAGAFEVALILKLKANLDANAAQIGIIFAAAGFGSVIGASVAPKIRRAFGYRAAFFWPIWALAIIYLLVAATASFPVIFILSFLEGAIALCFAIGVWSYRQETTTSELMGRVAGITGAIFKLLMPPVIILAGVLADGNKVIWAFGLAALINVIAAIFLVRVAAWGWPGRSPM